MKDARTIHSRHAGGVAGRALLVLMLLWVLSIGTAPREGAVAASAGKAVPSTVYPQWLVVDPQQPHTLYVGGVLGCTSTPGGVACPRAGGTAGSCTRSRRDGCPNWIERSVDGGATWVRLEGALGIAGATPCALSLAPVVMLPPHGDLLAGFAQNCGSPASSATQLLRSTDAGLHWQVAVPGGSYGGGARSPVASPVVPNRVYAVSYGGGAGAGGFLLLVSNDGGATWAARGNPIPDPQQQGLYAPAQLVPDPRQSATVFANLVPLGSSAAPSFVSRSIDSGQIWTALATPAGLSPQAGFAVALDPHEPGLLVGRTTDRSVPTSRRYLSPDGGRSWRTADCPGVLHGACPRFTVENVFGAGASYAFQDAGIYRFQGAGPAQQRLAVSDRLPAAVTSLLAVAGGTQQGSPLYLLASAGEGAAPDELYRSGDGGRSWQTLPVGALPNQPVAAGQPGALLVRATHHTVAPPFAATYRRLGLAITGYPVTEAYWDDGSEVQLFEHLRLERRGTSVVVGALGKDAFNSHLAQGDPALNLYQFGEGNVRPVPNGATVQYFPQTHQTVSGDLLQFWQAHGGLAVLGAPLTQVVEGTNGDGTGRSYAMQYFTNVRLERHPELAAAHRAILLGLLGDEWLVDQGWLAVP